MKPATALRSLANHLSTGAPRQSDERCPFDILNPAADGER